MSELRRSAPSSSFAPVVKGCPHPVSASLALKLPSTQTICPTCLATSYMAAILTVQYQYFKQGGVFRSMAGEPAKHTALFHRWRKAKIALANTIMTLEDLLQDTSIPPEDLAQLREALAIWQREMIPLARLPGMKYFLDSEEAGWTEDKKHMLLTMKWVRMALEKMEIQRPKEGITTTVFQCNGKVLQKSSSALTELFSVYIPAQIPCIAPLPRAFEDHLQRRPCTVPPLNAGMLKRQFHAYKTETAVFEPSNPNSEKRSGVQKSILKSLCTRLCINVSSNPSKHKSVRISDFVTISSDHLSISNPPPFKSLSRATTTVPHALHTDVEHKRDAMELFRLSRSYKPGVWTSTADSEKANTSFCSMSPLGMDLCVGQDLKKEELEKKIATQIKVSSRQWVTSWWSMHVAPVMELEVRRRVCF